MVERAVGAVGAALGLGEAGGGGAKLGLFGGDPGGQLLDLRFGGGAGLFRRLGCGGQFGASLRRGGDQVADFRQFSVDAGEGGGSVVLGLLLAGAVGVDASQIAGEAFELGGGGLGLALGAVLLDG